MRAHYEVKRHLDTSYRFHDTDRRVPKTRGEWPTIVRKQRMATILQGLDDGLTLDQIGRQTGLSAGRVGQIIRELDLRNRR